MDAGQVWATWPAEDNTVPDDYLRISVYQKSRDVLGGRTLAIQDVIPKDAVAMWGSVETAAAVAQHVTTCGQTMFHM